MALTATLALDVKKFEDGLGKATASLESFAQKTIKNTNRDLARMLEEFTGQKVVAEAARMAEAVQRVGGAAALTEKEQQRVNATVTEAIAKYHALGQEAPKNLLALQQATAGAVEKTSLLTRGAQALVAAFSVRAIVNATKAVLDFTGSLTDLSGKTGIGVEALQRLGYVTEQSGVSLEQIASGAVKLGKALVSGDASAVEGVKALGLNVSDLIAAGPEQAFLQIGAAIATIPNPMERSALATAIFGKAGADFLPAFSADMAAIAATAPFLRDELVKTGDDAGDALSRLSSAGRILLAEVIVPLTPAITVVADWLGSKLPAALQTSRDAIDWLIRKGLELQLWLYDMAVAIATTVRDVPVLGRVFGTSAGNIAEMAEKAQWARDTLNIFNMQGVTPAKKAVEEFIGPVQSIGNALETAGRKGKKAGEDLSIGITEFIGPLQTEQTLVTRSINETGQLTRRLEEWARVNGATLAPSIRDVNSALVEQLSSVSLVDQGWAQYPAAVAQHTTTASGGISAFFTQVLGGAQGFGQSISSIFQAAFTGGGGALGAVQAFATQALSGLLSMIPGIGQFVSAFAGPIVAMLTKLGAKVRDFFADLFGGPSRDELNGRNLVAEFENNLIGLLTSQQKAEAGGERWKEVVISIRDAYLAMGRTEAEALADAERLWKSSQQGAEASAKVIAEIEAKMKAAGAAATTAIDDIKASLDALPNEVRVRVVGDYEPPDMSGGTGYRTGTMGRHGDWFQDFGTGTRALLHGDEAVVTKRQAPAFAADVLTGGGRLSGGGAVVNVTVNAQGGFFQDYAGIQRLAKAVSDALVNQAELRGGFAFAGGRR